jgi:hypothetical protein
MGFHDDLGAQDRRPRSRRTHRCSLAHTKPRSTQWLPTHINPLKNKSEIRGVLFTPPNRAAKHHLSPRHPPQTHQQTTTQKSLIFQKPPPKTQQIRTNQPPPPRAFFRASCTLFFAQ